ncbi:SPOR domain-containing protein [Acidocella sp.]|uniref:SPOR domain-containing protein n=1 Tax=Acidocella sp. TaxID=50710 RepID=UPI00262CFBD8|nr:SPOR domain-containing protein [Acidocella sp.]
MISRFILALTAILASCAKPPAPPPGPVTFTVGNPYKAGGEWFYPRDFNDYDRTGLATVIDAGKAAPYTADNERFDANALAAASPVLQLPCIVTITNLVTGQSLDVRVNDRGPDMPGRVIAVTPRVAQLLDFPPEGVVEVEVKLNQNLSMQLAGAAGDGPKLTAAPVAGITAQSLAAPGQAPAGAAQQIGPAAAMQTDAATVTLSGTVTEGPPDPGPAYIRIPGFGSESAAFSAMARVPEMQARVVPQPAEDRTYWAVNIGPYHSVADADAALQQVLRDGISDPEIIVR